MFNTPIHSDKCLNCGTHFKDHFSWDKHTQRLSVLTCPSCGTLGPLKIVPLQPEIETVIRAALTRHQEGQEKYGVFDPVNDNRDLFSEIEQELLDTINYYVFQILKLKATQDKMTSLKVTHGKGVD